MAIGGLDADAAIRDVADASGDTIVRRDLAGGAERFVVVGGHAESSAKLFVEIAHADQLVGVGGELAVVVGDEELLVAGVPEARELAVEEDGRENRELVITVGRLAEFGGTAILLDAHNNSYHNPQ